MKAGRAINDRVMSAPGPGSPSVGSLAASATGQAAGDAGAGQTTGAGRGPHGVSDAGSGSRGGSGADSEGGAGRIGMWIFLMTDGMGFGALLLAYGVLRARAVGWPDPNERFAISLAAGMTLMLLTSSLAVLLAVAAAQQGRARATRAWLALTIVCGLAFLGGQALEYHHLLRENLPMGLTSGLFASAFYLITGFHGLHVIVGLLILASVMRGAGGRPPSAGRVEVAALFWHFVDFAWVAIFTFIYLMPVR